MKLGEFLKAAAGDRAAWNCSTLPADWCIALGHPDFAAAWRAVVDAEECDQVAADGLVALWEAGIGDALPIALEPLEAGDIAVVESGGVQAGAIWTGERFAIRALRGLHFIEAAAFRVLKAWRP